MTKARVLAKPPIDENSYPPAGSVGTVWSLTAGIYAFVPDDAAHLPPDCPASEFTFYELDIGEVEIISAPSFPISSAALYDLLKRLRDVRWGCSQGEGVRHLYRGQCPDDVEGWDKRDDGCPACRVLIEVDQLIEFVEQNNESKSPVSRVDCSGLS